MPFGRDCLAFCSSTLESHLPQTQNQRTPFFAPSILSKSTGLKHFSGQCAQSSFHYYYYYSCWCFLNATFISATACEKGSPYLAQSKCLTPLLIDKHRSKVLSLYSRGAKNLLALLNASDFHFKKPHPNWPVASNYGICNIK